MHTDNKDITLKLEKNSFVRFASAVGIISSDAKKSISKSLKQYKKGEFKILNNPKDLLK